MQESFRFLRIQSPDRFFCRIGLASCLAGHLRLSKKHSHAHQGEKHDAGNEWSAADLRTDLARLRRDTDSSRSALVSVDSAPDVAKSALHPQAESISDSVLAVSLVKRHKKGLAIGLAALALLLAVVGYGFYRPKSGSSNGNLIDSVAVLPFANIGGDPDTEYLRDGITESLINSLS